MDLPADYLPRIVGLAADLCGIFGAMAGVASWVEMGRDERPSGEHFREGAEDKGCRRRPGEVVPRNKKSR